jgi:hypothetical protein
MGFLALAALAACSPPPRAVGYFRAHIGEAAQVVVDCEGGSHHGPECANAEAAIAQQQSAARMAEYRKGF